MNIQRAAYERLAWEPGWIPFRFNCGPIRGSAHSQAITWGAGKEHAGVPDLAALVDGRLMVWIEIKQPGEAHLPSQRHFAEVVEAAGGQVYTAITPTDLERIIALVNREVRRESD